MPIVARILDQYLMGADRVACDHRCRRPDGAIAFDVIESGGMDDGARRPGDAGRSGDVETTSEVGGVGVQKRQDDSARGATSGIIVSGAITHERVMGSLRSSMPERRSTAGDRSQP